VRGFPAKKITLALLLSIFPATTLGVVFLCAFFLSSNGRKILNGEQIKRGVYTFFAAHPPVLGAVSERYISVEAKGEIIDQYFALQGAPLAGYGKNFIDTASKYDLPWTLLPAIAMQESNGGKKIPEETYNAWGWGITASNTLGFDSWEHGIETVAKGLRTNYLDRGLVTPQEIMTEYCPLSITKGGAWAKGVEYFQLELASF